MIFYKQKILHIAQMNALSDRKHKAYNTGPLVDGTEGQTLRHNGTSWVANSNIYNDGDKVGIGTDYPTSKLHIQDNEDNTELKIYASNTIDTKIARLWTINNNYSYGLGVNGNGDGQILGNVNLENPASVLFFKKYDIDNFKVGIGTDNPQEKLDVNGTVKMTGFKLPTGAGAGKVLISNADGEGIWQNPASINSDGDWTIAGDNMYSNVSGNIGIDTDDPEYKLDVKGSLWADNISTKSIQMITTNEEKSIPLETYISLIEFMKNQGKYSTGINSFECNKPPNNLKPVNTLINAYCGQVGIGVRSFNDNIFPKFEVDGGDVYFHYDFYIGGYNSSKIFSLASVNYVSNGTNKSYFAIRPPTNNNWNDYNALILTDEGKVSIGGIFNKNNTTNGVNNIPDGYKLYVDDGILTEKVKVALCVGEKNNPIDCDGSEWNDYVFDDDYKLMNLKDLNTYIKLNKHLPEIPSAKEVEAEGGFELGKMTTLLLQKVEELTLYIIQQNKQIEEQNQKIKELQNKNK